MKIIGHRGARGLAPENTIAALLAAIENNVDGVEFDVRVTKDNVPVLIHDRFLKTSENKKLIIKNYPLTVLREVKPDILTLEEALKFLDNKVTFVIEIKPGVKISPICDVLSDRLNKGLNSDLATVASFDYKILRDIKGLLPHISLAVNEQWSGVRATYRARKLGTKFITMNQKWLWSGFIRSMSKRGYRLSAYTLNSPSKAKKFSNSGLYAAITDFPGTL